MYQKVQLRVSRVKKAGRLENSVYAKIARKREEESEVKQNEV